jgi:hypothetical protein
MNKNINNYNKIINPPKFKLTQLKRGDRYPSWNNLIPILKKTANIIIDNHNYFINEIIKSLPSSNLITGIDNEQLIMFLSRRRSIYDYHNNKYTLIKNNNNIKSILKKIKYFSGQQVIEPFENDPIFIEHIDYFHDIIPIELQILNDLKITLHRIHNSKSRKRYHIIPIELFCGYDINFRKLKEHEISFINRHSNIIIIDAQTKSWTVIEPHGEIPDNSPKNISIVNELFQGFNLKYTPLSQINTMGLNPIPSNGGKPIQGEDTLCGIWSLFMLYGIVNNQHNNNKFHSMSKYDHIFDFIYQLYLHYNIENYPEPPIEVKCIDKDFVDKRYSLII